MKVYILVDLQTDEIHAITVAENESMAKDKFMSEELVIEEDFQSDQIGIKVSDIIIVN
ncbi:MAG: hypothetical protein WBP82_09140 [Leuconostoc mesenteroides]